MTARCRPSRGAAHIDTNSYGGGNRMDKLSAMQAFVQVVEAGTFTKAADNLGLPKPTVTRLVQSLEREGLVTVEPHPEDRRVRTVRLTPAGETELAELERHARTSGVTTLRLETNRSLTEAIALYRASGFTEVEPFNDEPHAHHWFAKPLR